MLPGLAYASLNANLSIGERFHDLEQAEAYLQLLEKTLTRFPLGIPDDLRLYQLKGWAPGVLSEIRRWARANQHPILARRILANSWLRVAGLEWPTHGETMIGLLRLENLRRCAQEVIRRRVPGDLLEAGGWRGGACIFMRGVLYAFGEADRKVWVADSFQGMPTPNLTKYPEDRNGYWRVGNLAVSLESVKNNFRRYGLLDSQVRFLPGWFSDTFPAAPIDRLAVLRLDGALYESTIDTLRGLYHRVSPGGYVIIDDYGAVRACRQAIRDFRRERGITTPIRPIDWTGVFWQVDERIGPEAQQRWMEYQT